jgi:uncharacterized protein
VKDVAPLSSTERTTLQRFPQRGRSARELLHEILDSALLCVLTGVVDGSPHAIPMVYGRTGETLYFHGSPENQVFVAGTSGGEVCACVVNLYGLVLANSLYHHSVVARGAMIYGPLQVVSNPEERLAALRASADQLVPGRGEALPDPTEEQLARTMVVALPLGEASVKIFEGPPGGDEADYELDIWAGVLPLVQTWGTPSNDPKLRSGIGVPEHVTRMVGKHAS